MYVTLADGRTNTLDFVLIFSLLVYSRSYTIDCFLYGVFVPSLPDIHDSLIYADSVCDIMSVNYCFDRMRASVFDQEPRVSKHAFEKAIQVPETTRGPPGSQSNASKSQKKVRFRAERTERIFGDSLKLEIEQHSSNFPNDLCIFVNGYTLCR